MSLRKYEYRIKFKLGKSDSINCNENKIIIDSQDDQFLILKSYPNTKKISEANEFILSAGTYTTEEEDYNNGQNTIYALMLTFTNLGMGFDFGKNLPTGVTTNYYKKELKNKYNVDIQDDVHGLMVLDTSKKNRFISFGTPTLIVSRKEEIFLEKINTNINKKIKLTEKENLAFELYGLSKFETSSRSRFILLVVAVESLLKKVDRNKNDLENINRIMEITKELKLGEGEVFLLNGLGELKKESISNTAKEFINKYLHNKKYEEVLAKDFFGECYKFRSQLVHKGKLDDDNISLDKIRLKLEKLVADLLTNIINPRH